jgi:uncharacterized protein (TIGR02466 family)
MAKRAGRRSGAGGAATERLARRVVDLHERARTREAREIHRKVLRGDDPAALGHFGRVAARYHEFALAAKLLERAVACGAADADTCNEAGLACLHAGRLEDAVRWLSEATRHDPGDLRCRLNLALVQKEQGELDAALATLEALEGAHPGDPRVALAVAELRLRRGEPGEALSALDSVLAGKPHPTWPLALQAVALSELGESERLHEQMRLPELVRVLRAHAPPGFADVEAFDARLRRHLARHRSLARDPEGYSTRGGRHSIGNLLRDRSPVIEGLEALIHGAVEAYVGALPGPDGHPFLERADRFRIEAWAVLLERGGHHVPHVHRDGWVSGVYYVSVDPMVRDDDPGHEGWLELGRGPAELHALGSEPPSQLVRPEAGHFVLFPSFCWHGTRPFEAEGERVAVAFDLIPNG